MSERLTPEEAALVGPKSMKAVGSPEWCWQTVAALKDALRHVDEQWRQAEEILEDLKRTRAWDKIPPNDPYGEADAMLKAEIGVTLRQVNSRIKEARERYGPIQQAAPQGTNRHSSRGYRITSRGTSADYTVARLKRDAPDLAERVVNGEITPNEAARIKGWRKPQITVSTPERVAASLRRHMAPDDLARLAELLREQP